MSLRRNGLKKQVTEAKKGSLELRKEREGREEEWGRGRETLWLALKKLQCFEVVTWNVGGV